MDIDLFYKTIKGYAFFDKPIWVGYPFSEKIFVLQFFKSA